MHDPGDLQHSELDGEDKRPEESPAPETDHIEEDGDPLGANFA